MKLKSVYIIADIEGSLGCLSKNDSQLFTSRRYEVCKNLTEDINAVCEKLFENGVERIRVKDFHRTGYNILAKYFNKRAELDQGFAVGPIPGIGEAKGFDALMMIGLHAASGTSGFLPHTLTSQLAAIEVNGKILTEAELFASSLYEENIAPVFFSGCSSACEQVKNAIADIDTFAIDKPLVKSVTEMRKELANAAAKALQNNKTKAFCMKGPFEVKLNMRDGEKAAKKIKDAWGFSQNKNEIAFEAQTFNELYWIMLKIAYMSPFIEKHIKFIMRAFNLLGKAEISVRAVLKF
ncbi:MAG: M55 family metallopeptidase [Candidatus Riflebacteria bacterium]|nr:M55 family metallopeptidase [Candidatus Riflebacteria bacterium]